MKLVNIEKELELLFNKELTEDCQYDGPKCSVDPEGNLYTSYASLIERKDLLNKSEKEIAEVFFEVLKSPIINERYRKPEGSRIGKRRILICWRTRPTISFDKYLNGLTLYFRVSIKHFPEKNK